MSELAWVLAVALFLVAGAWRNSVKNYRSKLNTADEATTVLYEQIYVADRLTGFVKRLEAINAKHKPASLRLADCATDLRNVITIVQRQQTHMGNREPIVLKSPTAADELELLRKKLIRKA